MRVKRTILAAAGAALALAAAGCGGSTAASGGDASSLAPAGSIVFASVDTDLGSDQWQKVDQLTNSFPIKARAIKQIETSLAKQKIDFSNDVKPALGPELDVAVIRASAGGVEAVGMTQPNDTQKFDALLAKLDASSHDGTKTLHEEVDGWTVFSDKQSAIDAVKQASNGQSLATQSSFNDAMGEVSQDALAKIYVNGSQVEKLLPGTAMLTSAAVPKLDWAAAELTAGSNTLQVLGAAKGSGITGQTAYTPQLVRDVPADAFVYVSWKDAARALEQYAGPNAGFLFGALQSQLGVSKAELVSLLQGEGALWVAAGAPVPTVALELQVTNEAQARATLEKLASGIAKASDKTLTTARTRAGAVPAIDLGPAKVLFAVANGRAIVTDSPDALKAPPSSLADDPSYAQALKDAGAPTQVTGLAYANLKDLVPFVTGIAGLSGHQLPAEVRANLTPLQYFVEYGTVSGDTAHGKAFLETR